MQTLKAFNKYSAMASVLLSTLVLGLSGQVLAAATKVDLGTADSFAVLAGQHITDVPSSVITGNVGLSPASGSFYAGLTSAEVTGTIYAVDGAGPGGSVNNPALLTTAKNDLTTAYVNAANQTPATVLSGSDNQLGGQTLTAGIYSFGHANTANLTAATPLILNGQGNANSIFIFQASSDLVMASASSVQLINGAQACNVYWQVTSSATLGTGSTFVGTIMALTSITDNGSSTVSGRLLARNADVVLNQTTVRVPACTTPTPSSSTSSTTPTLPNTGLGPKSSSDISWGLIAPAATVIVLSSLYAVRKKGMN